LVIEITAGVVESGLTKYQTRLPLQAVALAIAGEGKTARIVTGIGI